MSEIKFVVFDMGNTLLGYRPSAMFEKAFMEVCKKEKIQKEICLRIIERVRMCRAESQKTMKEFRVFDVIKSELGGNIVEASEILKKVDALYTKDLRTLPGAVKIMNFLADSGRGVGLVSNTCWPADYHRRHLEHFGLLRFFKFTIFSSDYIWRKPHPFIYQEAIRLSKCKAENILFVGDQAQKDVIKPQEAGMNALLINRGGKPNHSVPENLQIASLVEIKEKIDLFNRRQ